MADRERLERARARRDRMVLRKSALKPVEDDANPVRGEDALTLVHRLTLESWSLAGRPPPSYPRAQIPWRFVPGRLT
jgi:hypothetical protein